MNEQKIICTVKKKLFMTAHQIKNALQDEGIHASLSMIKRRLHYQNIGGLTTRCKPLVGLRNRQTSLQFAENKHQPLSN